MPYEGEFAGYRSLRRVAEAPRVRELLETARALPEAQTTPRVPPAVIASSGTELPHVVVAIDGSHTEIPARNGYPGAMIGYCTVASVLINLKLLEQLDTDRPVDPQQFRRTQETSSIDEALPGSNVVIGTNASARHSFREALFNAFRKNVVDTDERISLLDTYKVLLAYKPTTAGHDQACPYAPDCSERLAQVSPQVTSCSTFPDRPIYPTDALRIHETFREDGSNLEALGEVMQIWERVLLIHLLRAFERRGLLAQLDRAAFFVDGPLAVFGHPAWLSAAISKELKRLGPLARAASGRDLLILGIEKSGAFVTHFDEIDRTHEPGIAFFPPKSYQLLTDAYIKERVNYSASPKRYGVDTYFGRKFFYKTSRGGRIVASLPFLSEDQDSIETDDIAPYPRFANACEVLDALVSSRYANAVAPIVAAHAEASIPLHLGAKVLEQLTKALIDTRSGVAV